MATAKQSQFAVRPNTAPGHRAAEPRRTAAFLAVGVGAALGTAALALTGPGAAVASLVFHFLEFYCGVFSLVALSLTVMAGLAATDRVVLLVRHRVLMQGMHRALALAAMVFLAVHVATKIIEGHASVVDVVVPFLASHRPLYVGLGTLASYLMIGVTVTGVVRGRFAGSSRVWMWRALHGGAYLAWPVALLHGLNAGRAAKTWVTASYLLCLILVGLALLVRCCVLYGNRLRGPRTQTTATMRPVGKVTATPVTTSIALGPTTGGTLAGAGAGRGARRPTATPTAADRRWDTGSTPPVRDRVRDTGTTPVVRDRLSDTGSTPPVRDRLRDTGTTPVVRDRLRDTGSTPPVRDRIRDTGSTPVVPGRSRDTEPEAGWLAESGPVPAVPGRRSGDGAVRPSSAPPARRPAGERNGGRSGGTARETAGSGMVSDDDFWAFMRGEDGK